MSSTKKVRLADLDKLTDVFEKCGGAPRSPHESPENHRRFMIACGKNFAAVQEAKKNGQAEIDKIIEPSPEYRKFLKARDEICSRFCLRDSSGQPLLKDGKFQYGPKNLVRANIAVGHLQSEWEEEIVKQEAKAAEANKWVENGSWDLVLETVPWHVVPERISGPYLAELEIMIDRPRRMREPLFSRLVRWLTHSRPVHDIEEKKPVDREV